MADRWETETDEEELDRTLFTTEVVVEAVVPAAVEVVCAKF